MGGYPSGLGNLPLDLFSVSHEHENTIIPAPGPGSEGKPHSSRKPLTKVAAPPIYTGNLALHMALKRTSRLTKMGHGLVRIEKSVDRKGGVSSGRGMAVTYDHMVPVEAIIIFG